MCEEDRRPGVSLRERKTVVDVRLWVRKSLLKGSLPLLSSILDPQHLSPSYLVTKRGQQSSRNGGLFGAGGPQKSTACPSPEPPNALLPALGLGVGGDDSNSVSTY